MHCWNRCGRAILSHQTNWLIFWTLVIVKRKKRRRRKRSKTTTSLTLTISVNWEWCSENYNHEAHDRLRGGSSEHIVLAFCLPRSIIVLVIELSGVSEFTIPRIDPSLTFALFLKLMPQKPSKFTYNIS